MCRLLAVQSMHPFTISEHLAPFAEISKNSREYQGHGWGCSFRRNGEWHHYKNISPVWEDDLTQFGTTSLLLAHARSAYRDEGIAIENNMPFFDGTSVFIFNGELRGVAVKSTGRIGAEKIFNYIKRFDRGDMLAALKKSTGIITGKSRYVRAMNIILSDGRRIFVATQYSEDPDYFALRCRRRPDMKILCSEPYPGETGWEKIDNNTIMEF